MSTISRQIITAAVNVTESDVYSVSDIAAAMLGVMGHEEDWTTEFVREVMTTVIFVVSTDDNEEYADVAAIIIEAARAIVAGAARADDEHGWVDVDDIEVAFETVQSYGAGVLGHTGDHHRIATTKPAAMTSKPVVGSDPA